MKLMALLAVVTVVTIEMATQTTSVPWAVYYENFAEDGLFDDYNLVVLDTDFRDDLGPLAARGRTLLGYLSIGEVNVQRDYFEEVSEESILFDENPNWEGRTAPGCSGRQSPEGTRANEAATPPIPQHSSCQAGPQRCGSQED